MLRNFYLLLVEDTIDRPALGPLGVEAKRTDWDCSLQGVVTCHEGDHKVLSGKLTYRRLGKPPSFPGKYHQNGGFSSKLCQLCWFTRVYLPCSYEVVARWWNWVIKFTLSKVACFCFIETKLYRLQDPPTKDIQKNHQTLHWLLDSDPITQTGPWVELMTFSAIPQPSKVQVVQRTDRKNLRRMRP